MRLMAFTVAVGIAVATPARADTDYFGRDAPPSEGQITYKKDLPRTTGERLLIGGLLFAAAAAGGVGLYYHLQSRDEADEVGSPESQTQPIYTPELDAVRRDALHHRNLAIAGYAVGAGLVAGAVVALFLTEPGKETVTVQENGEVPATVVPVSLAVIPGGAVVGAGWSF